MPATQANPRSMAARIRAVLTHPVVVALKRRIRGARWLVAGAGVRNPVISSPVTSVLFVCLGNICRSPFGALRARCLLAEAGRTDVKCGSAGIRTSQGARAPVDAVTAARQYGVSLDHHVPLALTRQLVARHDMVIVMEASQADQLRALYPEFRDRIFLLALYDDTPGGAYERCNIADPFGQPLVAFEACYWRIERALRGWVRELTAAGDPK